MDNKESRTLRGGETLSRTMGIRKVESGRRQPRIFELRQIATDDDRKRHSLALVGNCGRSRRFATVGLQRRPASGRQTPVVEHKGSGMRRCRFAGLSVPIPTGYGGLRFSTAASRLGCAFFLRIF